MGKKKTNQAQQTQRLQDVDDNFTDNNQTNRPSQKLTEEKVNRVHDIFPDWPKADIRRALEDSDYDEERVVQSHLQGGDSWQEVSKTKVKETVSRPKSRRTASGNQNTGERVERSTRSERGRGGGRGGKSMGLTRSDRKTDTDVTAASVKEFVAPVKETTDDNVQQGTRSFRSYSEAAAVSNEPIVSEPVVVQTKPERKERPKRERQPPVKKQQPVLQEIVSPTSPPTSHQQQQQQHNRDVISPPQPSPKKSLSPQDKKQDAVVLPVGFNAVDVQFGSLGINDTEQAQANVVENPSAPLEQKESQTEFYGQAWGGSEQYQNEPVTQSYEEGANAQYQQQYQQQQQLYGFQQSQQTQTQPRTDKGSQAQRTSPNLQYGKQPSYAPTHPYTGIHGGAQNPYQYPTYPSYPHPYMMPNQFQYHNYPMPGNKYGQFYGQNKPYNAYAPTQGNATAPTEESNLDYNKQFEMTNPNYFYMQHHPQQHQGAQTETGKTKKDSRSPNEQGVDAQQQQQHQAFGHYPYAMHYGYMGFQPQNMGFPQQQYQPQPTTQQGAQSHGKGSSNQQQQSSLTGSTWQ